MVGLEIIIMAPGVLRAVNVRKRDTRRVMEYGEDGRDERSSVECVAKRGTNFLRVRRGQIKDTRSAITSLSHRPGVGRDGQLFALIPMRRAPAVRTGPIGRVEVNRPSSCASGHISVVFDGVHHTARQFDRVRPAVLEQNGFGQLRKNKSFYCTYTNACTMHSGLLLLCTSVVYNNIIVMIVKYSY